MDPEQPMADPPPLAAAVPAPEQPSAAPVPDDTAHQALYTQMISAAIVALKEPDGSSSRAIAKYIEQTNSNLPPDHSALLNRHLKLMKNSGELIMIKHSYSLPGFTPPPPDLTPITKRKPGRPPKRKLGAETLPQLSAQEGHVQTDSFLLPAGLDGGPPTSLPQVAANVSPAIQGVETLQQFSAPEGHVQTESVLVAPGLDGGPVIPLPPLAGNVSLPKRGRGRPKKLNSDGTSSVGSLKPETLLIQNGRRRPGRPPKSGNMPWLGGVVGRPRGRPKRFASTGIVKSRGRPKVTGMKLGGRPRGRPAKKVLVGRGPTASGVAINVPIIDGDARNAPNGVLVAPRRRGRPPKLATACPVGVATNGLLRTSSVHGIVKPRKFTGKRPGRPRKDAALTIPVAPNTQQLEAFQDLQAKYENLKTRASEIASVIKPCLNRETMPAIAMAAFQELESFGGR
ncbi:unnamed protein product [Cuscuta epithymum]|uniref:H15 domain-containing protein n=1 Tax=Cuscuta epithymum TaxID=186058 RepID=A0AAV0CFD1_9ASTE|nr:unnamed protein product [Cuscuta epithymum]CAH9141059.1 unnamed protein product [Cuscuta epithymum]